MSRSPALLLALIGALVLAWWSARTPEPQPAEAAPEVFSAGRAMIDVQVLARTPHPVGSPANAAARDYLLDRMRAMGLSPEIQRAEAGKSFGRGNEQVFVGATVENLVGVLPGRDHKAPALAIMAHYDSVPGSSGAADDATGVASALEVVRALKLKGPLARDVVVLITDGEEAGLLGAEAFFRLHPLARRIGFILNMEARGGGGKVQMFQTGAGNGQAVDLFRRTAVNPAAGSLSVFVYEHLPNDTDFTISKAAGIGGLNYAFIGRQFDYHSPTSTSDHLDQGSLQHMGDQVLAVAQAAASEPSLPAKTPDLVYSHTFGDLVAAYPPEAGWAILAVAAVLLGLGIWRARRANAFALVDILRGFGTLLYLAVTAAGILHAARRLTGAGFGFFEQRVLLAQAHRWEFALLLLGAGAAVFAIAAAGRGRSRIPAALLAALAGTTASLAGLDMTGLALGGAGALLALATFGRPGGVAGVWAGALGLVLVLGTAAQAVAPLTAYVIAWPLVLATAGAAAGALGSQRNAWTGLVNVLVAAVGLGWLLGLAHVVYLGLDIVELLTLFAVLGALLLWPATQGRDEDDQHQGLAWTLLAAGLAVTVAVRLVEPWSARHPRAAPVTYRVDQTTGQALRVALGDGLDPWSRKVLAADGGRPVWMSLPDGGRRKPEHWAAPAMAVQVPEPAATLVRQADGRLLLSVIPQNGAGQLGLELTATTALQAVTINGRPVQMLAKSGDKGRVGLTASPQGAAIGFSASGPGEIKVRYVIRTPGWPASARPLPPMPAKIMGFDGSPSTTLVGVKRFSW